MNHTFKQVTAVRLMGSAKYQDASKHLWDMCYEVRRCVVSFKYCVQSLVVLMFYFLLPIIKFSPVWRRVRIPPP
jgi:hypothetical protein